VLVDQTLLFSIVVYHCRAMSHLLTTAVQRLLESADVGAAMLNRYHVMNRQWLSLQQSRTSDPTLFECGRALFSQRIHRQLDFDPVEEGDRSHSLPRPELLAASTRMLDGIMAAWQPRSDPYDLSDWEDDDAMKEVEIDADCRGSDGKAFPDWASGSTLESAVAKQNPNDGDLIFRTMARRCDLVEMFGTSRFEYYQKRRQ
jgi:hypothetical protein